MLEWNWAEERLASSRNYWIVTTGDGAPAAARLGCLVRRHPVLRDEPTVAEGEKPLP